MSKGRKGKGGIKAMLGNRLGLQRAKGGATVNSKVKEPVPFPDQ